MQTLREGPVCAVQGMNVHSVLVVCLLKMSKLDNQRAVCVDRHPTSTLGVSRACRLFSTVSKYLTNAETVV